MTVSYLSPDHRCWSDLLKLLHSGLSLGETPEPLSPSLVRLLEENHRLFNAMVNAFDGLIYICSLDYRIEYLNERMIQHLGRDATDDLCYTAFGRRTVCPWCVNHRVARGETLRWELISPLDGRWYYVVNAPVRHLDGTISKYAIMMDIHERKQNENELKRHRDHLGELVRARTAELTAINDQLHQKIKERMQAEQALRHSEAKYRDLIKNANSLIMRFDIQGRLTFLNEYAQHFLGYRESDILGRTIEEALLPPLDSAGRPRSAQFHDFLEDPGKYKVKEFENVRSNGERVWVAWNNRPISNDSGKIVEFLCVGMDVTERNQNRQQIQTLTHELIKTQENERSRLSRDLHDHIAQDLSSLKIRLQTLFDSRPPIHNESHQQVDDMIQILQHSISEVRDLAYDLRPPELDQLGLVRTLFVYCEDFAQHNGLKIDYIAAGLDNLALDEDIQINIYRLIQEALHNVKKHARAKGVTIRLVASSPNLMLRIIDDGQGFDVHRRLAKTHQEKRMGLQSMIERVKLLNGTIDIRSRPQKGTGIFITIPIKEQYRARENPDCYCG